MTAVIPNLEALGLLVVAAGLGLVFANYLPSALYLDVFLVIILYIGWYSSPFKGTIWGFTFGLVSDFITGLPLGLNGLSKTVLGFSASYLSAWVMLESIWVRFVLIGLLSLLDSAIIYVLQNLLGEPQPHMFWMKSSIKAVVTGIAGGLFFRMYDRMKFPPKDFRRIEDTQ